LDQLLNVFKRREGSKMKIKILVFMCFVILAGSTAFSATSYYYIPQVAVGAYDSGSYRTTFVFFNNTATAANVTLSLTNDGGTPMSVTIPGLGTNSTFTFTLGGASTRIIQTDSSGAARAGAAIISSDSPIGVSGLYTVYAKDGSFVSEVGVNSATPMTSFIIPVQTSGTVISTGLALFNPATTDSSVTATLKNTDGTTAGASTFTLKAKNHIGVYLDQAPFSLPIGSSFKGTLTIQSSVAISAMTLRQNTPSSTTLVYTSCPVVSTASADKTFNLAHVVDGSGFKTTFMLFNFSTSTANVTLQIFKDDGTANPVTIPDLSLSAKDTFTFTIGAGKSLFLQTNGTGTVTGKGAAALITSDVPIGTAGLFTQYIDSSMTVLGTEAGIQSSPAYSTLTLPIDSNLPDADTGIAIFNPGTASVTVTPVFMDTAGITTPAAAPITIAAKGHTAAFFGEMFPGMGNIQGSLAVTAPTSVAAVTMRENLKPSFSMTSLPVIQGMTAGITLPTTGYPMAKTQKGIAATADATFNAKVPFGHLITLAPTVTGGTLWSNSLSANSGGNSFPVTSKCSGYWWYGIFCIGTVTYSASVPPGDFTFKLSSYVGSQTSAFTKFYTSDPITIAGPQTGIPVAATYPTLYTVTGNITGLTTTSGFVVLTNTNGSGDYGYFQVSSSPYTASVSSGTYSIAYSIGTGGNFVGGPFYPNLGTVTVNDANATAPDIAVPTLVTLSGTTAFKGAAPASSTITATNSAATGYNTVTATSANDSYQMQIPKGVPYDMRLSYSVYADTSTTAATGTVNYTPTSNTVTINADSTFNFTGMPAAPDFVTISGTVTDSGGTAISGATVTASSSVLTGTPSTSSYSGTATSDTTGTYSIKVPKGTKYQLAFSPPAP